MKFAFVLFFVFYFFLYLAKTHSFVPRYGDTNSPKIFTGYTLPVLAVPNRMKRQTLDGYAKEESVINIGNGQGKHNVVVVDKTTSSQDSSDSYPDPDINVGNYPNNKKAGTNRSKPPVNSNRGYHPFNQYEPNLGNRFGNYPPQGVDNSRGSNDQIPRREINNNNIGNGIGNRNIVSIQSGAFGLDRSYTESLPPFNRRPTNKNNRKFSYYQTTETPKNFDQRAYNSKVSRTNSRIGQGTNNRNIVVIDGTPFVSDSGVFVIMEEANNQGSKHTTRVYL